MAGRKLAAKADTPARRPAEIRLQRKIENANTTTYRRVMHGAAKEFGGKAPATITDQGVTDGIAQRAAISAKSIVDTRQARMASLIQQFGSKDAAQAAYNEWQAGQDARIAAFEASIVTHTAQDDLVANNSLTGTERCEPTDTAGLDDTCDAAVALGDVPIGQLPDLPAHFACPHVAVQTYDTPDDPSAMWFGA